MEWDGLGCVGMGWVALILKNNLEFDAFVSYNLPSVNRTRARPICRLLSNRTFFPINLFPPCKLTTKSSHLQAA